MSIAFDAPAVYRPEATVIPDNAPQPDFTILPRIPESVRAARHWVVDTLAKLGVPDAPACDAVQIVSEFGQNAIKYVATGPDGPGVMTVTVAVRNGHVELTLSDPGALFELPQAGPNGSGEHEGGYGLRRIVNTLSSEWGIEPIDNGKIAWALVPVTPEGGAP